jgi:hypothetical protein
VRRLFCAALCALSVSCSQSRVVGIDRAFSEEQVALIVQAGETWNRVSDVPIVFVRVGYEWKVRRRPTPKPCDGWTVYPDRTIDLDPHDDGLELFGAALHEFGHMLRLKHLPASKRGIMGEVRDGYDLSDDDVLECVRVGSCG